ncbi:MAG TPA: NAD-binding protein [Anaerolineae bacterium]|nr:NAD-binding protein [Anaerolineae bacterium]HMR63604.1 NAD-binding protein [Anaerolineae bacterium]
MFVLIGGGGRTGTQLAILLVAQHHEVHLIEHRRDVLTRLHRELPTEVIYEGYPTDLLMLEQAGIAQAQVVAACTNSDADNLTMCYVARTRYHVPRTLARINNPRNAWLFDHKFHVDAAFNQAEIMASLIQEEMPPGVMMTLLKLNRGNFSLVEEKISAGAPAIGQAIQNLALPHNCVIAAIIRDEQMVVPRGQTVFQVGDEILAVVDHPGAEQLAKLLSPAGKAA